MCCGSPAYASPELVLRVPYRGEPVDVWALGVMLYAMLSNTYPFDGESIQALYYNIVKSKPHLSRFLPAKAATLLESMLRKEPQQRPTLADVRNSDWLRSGSFMSALKAKARIISDGHHIRKFSN